MWGTPQRSRRISTGWRRPETRTSAAWRNGTNSKSAANFTALSYRNRTLLVGFGRTRGRRRGGRGSGGFGLGSFGLFRRFARFLLRRSVAAGIIGDVPAAALKLERRG